MSGYRPPTPRTEEFDFKSRGGVVVPEWDAENEQTVAFWKAHREAIDLARQGSRLPHLQFRPIGATTILSPADPAVQGLRVLAALLALDAGERRSLGDLEGAWDDVLAMFRMARQSEESGGMMSRLIGSALHHRAVKLGMEWAADPRQTPDRLRAALADLRKLPPPPTIAEALKVEYAQIDALWNLPTEEFREVVGPIGIAPWGHSYGSKNAFRSAFEAFTIDMSAGAPWERAHARRAFRLIFADLIDATEHEPWRRTNASRTLGADATDLVVEGRHVKARDVFQAFRSTVLARLLLPAVPSFAEAVDREEVLQAALVQVLALRAWQLGHDGAYPETLAELVPSELPSLPLDPHSGKPFHYVRSKGQNVPELGVIGIMHPDRLHPSHPGQWLLYSVGPDRTDAGGTPRLSTTMNTAGDEVFPLPDGGKAGP